MCAQFLIKAKFKDLQRRFHIQKEMTLDWEERVLPYRKAPVVVNKGEGLEVRLMNFSLIPSWATDARLKFATHNARIETVAEKATWKKSFIEKRCLVPLSNFIEPIYVGPFAGNMVAFSPLNHDEIMAAAGLWSEWVNKKTGEVIESFAIITGEPSEFVRKTGHDRQPVFLPEGQWEPWSDPHSKTPAALTQILQNAKRGETFDVTIDRPLKNKKKPVGSN